MISPHESASRRQISKLRSQKRVEKTSLDYLVAALNPLLIMLLVGSLVFFLIQVFYRGEMAGGVRWVMFWFVLAVVLVSRIGIEQSPVHAGVYGAGLAAAAWLFLMQTHPAFLLGIICLAVVWWSAHQLVQDCALIDDAEDFTHQGLLEKTTERTAKKPQAISSPTSQNLAGDKSAGVQKRKSKSPRTNQKKNKRASRPPGRRVLFFSLAALPLFGLGQWFAEARNSGDGQSGFPLLIAYFAAACGLLLSTSFLGMRRYLRQRSIKMPANIASSWMIFGAGIGGFVLLLAIFAPRPGVGAAWMEFSRKIDSLIQNASEAAMRFNPAGIGKGREGLDSIASRNAVQNTENPRSPNADPQSQSGKQPQLSNQGRPENGAEAQAAAFLARILKNLLIGAACIAAVIFLCCKRRLLTALIVALSRAILGFLRNLSAPSLRRSIPPKKPVDAAKKNRLAPFRRFQNPFVSGQSERWPPEVLIAYTYEALQSWSKETGDPDSPEETPVERSRSLARRHPALHPWVLSLGEHYSLLAYGQRIPRTMNALFLRKIWAAIAIPVPKAAGILAPRKATAPHSSSSKYKIYRNRILIYFVTAPLAGCGLPSSAPKETVGMFLSQPEYRGWESEAHKLSAQKEVERTIRKFNVFVKNFTTINIRFYKKDTENGVYIEWGNWENRAGETEPSYDRTLIYEAVFQKKKFPSRKYKCINIAGEYYIEKQHPVATKFARGSYTLPLPELDSFSYMPPLPNSNASPAKPLPKKRRTDNALLPIKNGV